MKDTVGLSALLVTVVGLIAFRTDIKLLDGIETRLQAATSIGAVAFVQAVLNGNAMVEHPMVIKNIVKQKSVRIVLLVFTAFSIIHDLELAVCLFHWDIC